MLRYMLIVCAAILVGCAREKQGHSRKVDVQSVLPTLDDLRAVAVTLPEARYYRESKTKEAFSVWLEDWEKHGLRERSAVELSRLWHRKDRPVVLVEVCDPEIMSHGASLVVRGREGPVLLHASHMLGDEGAELIFSGRWEIRREAMKIVLGSAGAKGIAHEVRAAFNPEYHYVTTWLGGKRRILCGNPSIGWLPWEQDLTALGALVTTVACLEYEAEGHREKEIRKLGDGLVTRAFPKE